MRNPKHFERLHFVDSALVALRAAEASLKKCFDQFPGQRWPDDLPAERKYIHVVVFNALVSRKYIMDETSAHTGNLVCGYGCSHSAAAERQSAIHLASGHSPGHRDDVIRIVVSWAQVKRAEVHNLVARASQ